MKKHPTNYFWAKITYQEYLFKEFYVIYLTRRPNSLTKIGYIVLNSLSKSSRANINFFRWIVWYQMHGICLRVAFKALSILVLSMQSLLRLSLVFWDIFVFFWLGILYCIVTLLVIVEISNITQVFFVGLVGRKLLFPIGCVCRGGISKLIFPGVFILLFCSFIALEKFGIDFSNVKKWL